MRLLLIAALVLCASACHLGMEEPGGGGAAADAAPGGWSGDGGTGPGGRYHPLGYAAVDVHGADLKRRATDCRACHGDLLEGVGTAPSCDGCHSPTATPSAWRTDCTFCHGGGDNETGAPPRNLDGTLTAAEGLFPAHGKHVTEGIAKANDCMQCHVKAVDVLSPGHVFDDTPGAPETDMGTGLSPQGQFTGTGCANLYCHGDGRADTGSVLVTESGLGCASCHAGPGGAPAEFAQMSGTHALHLGLGDVTCADCHRATTTADGAAIGAPALHVDGLRQVQFTAAGVTYDAAAQTCTGTCHTKSHAQRPWIGGGGGGGFHPIGFSAGMVHGPEASLQRQNCQSCHGATLTGGTGGSAPSCDSCHSTGWRRDCTFCHGGGDNATGAPPRDLGAAIGSGAVSFVAHTKHVSAGVAPAFECTQCHRKPTDVLDAGHAFDGTPAMAEVTFAAGTSATGVYAAATGQCSNLYCHGNGRADNGTVLDGAAPMTCRSCHPGMGSGETAWKTMSGDHAKHLKLSGVTCGDCHQTVTTNGLTIANRALHLDRGRAMAFLSGVTYNAGTRACAGSCHGHGHEPDERW